jgi:hypothetical protein
MHVALYESGTNAGVQMHVISMRRTVGIQIEMFLEIMFLIDLYKSIF